MQTPHKKRVNSQTSLKSTNSYLINRGKKIQQSSKQKRTTQSHSLSSSTITLPKNNYNRSASSNGIKLSNSYYNDGKNIYMSRSQSLSERTKRYQNKDISFSVRKKYDNSRLQSCIQRRATSNQVEQSGLNPEQVKRKSLKKRFDNLNVQKYQKLVYGSKQTLIKRKMLEKSISTQRTNGSKTHKWMSPYKDGGDKHLQYGGKSILPEKIPHLYGNKDPSQLKVLNLDRMFKKKQGVLTNVVPLPTVKLQAVTARSNVMKAIKKKDKIHDIIQQYNRLIRIMTLKKTQPRIGVRGKNFTAPLSLQQLMGLKPNLQKKIFFSEKDDVSDQIFLQYCTIFNTTVKQESHLVSRILAGLKRNRAIDLHALTRFYSIFVNKVAQMPQKIEFLCYYFIPFGQEKIQLQVLKLILEIMCQKLPSIDNLNVRTDLLTEQQKSKIFLEALHRVLFADFKQVDGVMMVNREMIRMIFQRNPDAVDLLIKLMHCD